MAYGRRGFAPSRWWLVPTGRRPLDRADELAHEQDFALEAYLGRILKVSANDPSRANSDLDHLFAHQKSGADAFVTTDRKTILRHANQLLELGVRVLPPQDTLAASMATQ